MRLQGLLVLALCFASTLFGVPKLVWPTPSTAYLAGEPITKWVQPTGSGVPESGLYGCTRTNGYQFHEGLDIAPQKTNRKGVPLDAIYAIMPGKVVYVNSKAGYSNYGKYVIIEHYEEGLTYTSLYAHMASVADNIKAGVIVKAGSKIGVMGHTASNGIPLSRSHLHLEMGLQLTSNFQPWYDAQKYGQKNRHGNFSGFNFISWNPLSYYHYYRKGKLTHTAKFIRAHPTAVIAIVRTTQVPWFVKRNPALLSAPIPSGGVKGWQVEFTDVGVPKLWTPLTTAPAQKLLLEDGSVSQAKCRKLKKNATTPGKNLKGILEMLFGVSAFK